ncbi:MAG TPA: DUF4115 domain-containing protein [Candidatus Kapabacteria bacterium]|nr:DUF4115 domain-containing protein [Candidatus Kapabacteria bacterium]
MANISDILKSAREKANLSIEDLSEQTKIRPNIIASIENNDFSNFQAVYLKAYIRNLAKELQIENDPAYIAAYQEFINELKTSKSADIPSSSTPINKITISDLPEYETEYVGSKNEKISRFSPIISTNLLIYSGIIIFVIVVLFITFSPFHKSKTTDNKNTNAQNEEKASLVIKNNNEESLINYFKGSDSLILKANVTDSVWINITIDSTKRSNTILLPNKEYEWRAAKSFLITHGNAGNIKFFLNGKELEPFAKPGYIAKNVRITKEGIVISQIDSLSKMKAKKKQTTTEPPIRSIEPTEIEPVKPILK